MSASGVSVSTGSVVSPRRVGAAAVVTMAVAAAAVVLGGRGLLVPAGPADQTIRVVGVTVAVVGFVTLVRTDGPARAVRTLGVVGAVGVLTGLATLPASPVTALRDEAESAERAEVPGVTGTGALEDVNLESPGAGMGDALPGEAGLGGKLVLPPRSVVELESGHVVAAVPGVGSTALGTTAAAGSDPAVAGGPPVSGEVIQVLIGPAGPSRVDGGVIGGSTPLRGAVIEAGGRTVVVGADGLYELADPGLSDRDSSLESDLPDGIDVILAVLLGCFALIAFAPPVARFADVLVGSLDELEEETEPEPHRTDSASAVAVVEERLSEVLRSMMVDPDPRTAVIGAYARLLEVLAVAGTPRRSEETPHEHLWRALGGLGVRRAPVHRLAELFVVARFTPQPLDESDRRAAIAALADAVADLRLRADDVEEVVRTIDRVALGATTFRRAANEDRDAVTSDAGRERLVEVDGSSSRRTGSGRGERS